MFQKGQKQMQLLGVNRSPFTRRVAITLHIYGIAFEQQFLSGFGNRTEVRAANPLSRIPALKRRSELGRLRLLRAYQQQDTCNVT